MVDLEALADDLRSGGFEVEIARPGASTWSRMRESAVSEFVHVLNVVLNEVERDAVSTVVGLVIGWALHRAAHRGRPGARPTVIIWVLHGDDAEDVREEPLPDAESDGT